MNLILTLVIVIIAIIAIRFIWTNKIDYLAWFKSKLPDVPVTKDSPKLNYGISSSQHNYKTGININDVIWRENYSEQILNISNSSQEDIFNTIISISLPAGIVKSKIESSVNVFNINISSFNKPIIIGNSKIEETLSNYCDISIEKLNKHSTITIGFILDYRFKPKEWWNSKQGYWQFDISYEFENNQNTKTRTRFIHPVKILNEKPLVISIDKETNYVNQNNIFCTQDRYPFNPIISKPNGDFVQFKDFDGNFDKIKLLKGEGLLNSTGIDFQVNTDEEYK